MSVLTRRTMMATASATALISLLPTLSLAEDAKVVEMLNKHPDDKKKRYVFLPRVISVQPGETVVFKSVDKGHNSATIKGMVPEGAEDWNGKINKDIEVTFDTPGFYGYKCTPHSTVGMVGLVVVEGERKLDNLEDARETKHRGKSKKEWKEIWEEAEEMGLLEETAA